VEQHKHTNSILIQAPHRHDLREWSCVNMERKKYNRKLIKLMKNQGHVTVMNVDLRQNASQVMDSTRMGRVKPGLLNILQRGVNRFWQMRRFFLSQ
jgi:hypothetical protein